MSRAKWWIVALMLGVLGFSTAPLRAQDTDDYTRGYLDGYTGRISRAGEPGVGRGYGRGFQAGQDDAADDAETDRRNLANSEQRSSGHAPTTSGGDDDEQR
jgi:hypothetical protein